MEKINGNEQLKKLITRLRTTGYGLIPSMWTLRHFHEGIQEVNHCPLERSCNSRREVKGQRLIEQEQLRNRFNCTKKCGLKQYSGQQQSTVFAQHKRTHLRP